MSAKAVEKTVRHRKPSLKADYRGATPKQVGLAVLRYLPPAKQRRDNLKRGNA